MKPHFFRGPHVIPVIKDRLGALSSCHHYDFHWTWEFNPATLGVVQSFPLWPGLRGEVLLLLVLLETTCLISKITWDSVGSCYVFVTPRISNPKHFSKNMTMFPRSPGHSPQKIDRFMGFPQPPKPPRPTQAASMTRPKPPRPNSRTRRKAPSGTLAARRSAEKRHKMDGWKGDKLKDWKQNCMKYYEVMYIYIYTLKLILYLHIFVKSNFYPNSVQWDTF